MSEETAMKEGVLTDEEYREYLIPGREKSYRIMNPQKLFYRVGGTTHRVLDAEGVVHCVPAVGHAGTILRWKPKEGTNPVAF